VSHSRSSGVDFELRYVLIGLGDDDVRPFGEDRSYATRDRAFGERD
jgi:hypothetical protein